MIGSHSNTTEEYNLLKLMNGKTVQLTDQYFPAGGMIDKIRLKLGNNNRMVTVTDKPIPLEKSPNVIEHLIIDNVNAALPANVIVSIVIDINAALSVYELNGNYYLDPRARAYPETYGGSLRGYVAPIEASPVVLITREGDSLFSLPEGSDGMFLFSGLEEGAWKVHLFANPESGYRDTIFFSDSIRQGSVTDITPNPYVCSCNRGFNLISHLQSCMDSLLYYLCMNEQSSEQIKII